MKTEVRLDPIPFPDVAAWLLVATILEYVTCKQNLNKEGVLLLQEFKSGDHIATSKEFKQLAYMCCFGLNCAVFAEDQTYVISDKELQTEKLRQ